MTKIGRHILDIGRMDTLAAGDSYLHRLDPRVKLFTTLFFIIMVVSFNKYAISALIPFFIFPVVLIAVGGLPAGYLLKKVLLVSPFAVLIGIFNPLIDRDILLRIGSVGISGGWVSFLSILIRFTLTVWAVLVLIAATGFNSVCAALARLGVPRPFVVQLMFLYRYLFVLTAEVLRMVRAVSLRSLNSRSMGFKTYASMLGHLLLRTLDRAQRIHMAMLSRGFDGRVRLSKPAVLGIGGISFALGWVFLFVILRWYNVSEILGILITELL